MATSRMSTPKKNESGCKGRRQVLFPHHKVDEQPNKKPRKSDHSPKRRESNDTNAVSIVRNLTQMGCVSQHSELLNFSEVNKPRETRRKKSWDRFEEYESVSLRYIKRVSGKRKGPSLGKINVKVLHQRSPYAVKFQDWSHEGD